MARIYTNTSCPFYNTRYCRALNMESCDKCFISEDNASGVMQDIDAVLNMMPEGGIYQFIASKECMFCKGESKNPTSCYAMADLGNPEPKREKRNVLGMKVKANVGSILPLQLACCKACRRRFNTLSNRHLTIPLFTGIAAMGLLNYKPIGEAIANIHMGLPLLIFVVLVGGAWLACKLTRKSLVKKYSELTWLKVMDIPQVSRLADYNWFELSPAKDMSRLVFSREPLKRGLMTGPLGEEENI